MSILYVMAAEPEYGPQLRARIDALICGIGPVESAIAVTRELATLQAKGGLPTLVVSLGSAGSRTLVQAEVYQATSVSYRDMDASALGFPKGETPMSGLPAVLPLSPQVRGVKQASLSTGANVVSGAAYDAIDADMVDMETFAILRACQVFGVPLIALRGISDGTEALQKLSDWTRYLDVIDARLATVVDSIEADVEAGRLP
jgi:5''-methylthioadenosine/S-adenosylhomocysteine nucleosidase, putative